jgi:hypothetical protein
MSNLSNVDVAFKANVGSDIEHNLQQRTSAVMPYVRVVKITGKSDTFRRALPKDTIEEITTRFGATPLNPMQYETRRILMRSFEDGDMLDKTDVVKLLSDPRNKHSEAIAMSFARKLDKLLLLAAVGNAPIADADDALTQTALSAAQIIDEDIGTSNSKLNVTKLRAAALQLKKSHVNFRLERPTCFLTADDEDALLSDSNVISADYNTTRVLVDGAVDSFMGFKFVQAQVLEDSDMLTSEGFARAVIMIPSSLEVRMSRGVEVEIGPDPSYKFNPRLYAAMDFGATRAEEAKVVVIESYRA